MWIYGVLDYWVYKKTGELLLINSKNTIKIPHVFIGKKLKMGLFWLQLLAINFLIYKKILLKTFLFLITIIIKNTVLLNLLADLRILQINSLFLFFDYRTGNEQIQNILNIKNTNLKDFYKNLILNFKSILNLSINEEFVQILEVYDEEKSLKFKIKTKSIVLIADEYSKIYVEKYISVKKKSLKSLELFFSDMGIGGEDSLAIDWHEQGN